MSIINVCMLECPKVLMPGGCRLFDQFFCSLSLYQPQACCCYPRGNPASPNPGSRKPIGHCCDASWLTSPCAAVWIADTELSQLTVLTNLQNLKLGPSQTMCYGSRGLLFDGYPCVQFFSQLTSLAMCGVPLFSELVSASVGCLTGLKVGIEVEDWNIHMQGSTTLHQASAAIPSVQQTATKLQM